MMKTTETKHPQISHPLYIRIFSQYFLLIFMIFLVFSASVIVLWTAFFLPENDTTAQRMVDTDVVSLLQTREILAEWLRTLPEEQKNFSENLVLSAENLPENFPFSDLQNFKGIGWTAGRDFIGLENLPGDNIQIYIQDFDGEEIHLYDGWRVLCPVWEKNCYFQLVNPENLIDLTTIKFILSE